MVISLKHNLFDTYDRLQTKFVKFACIDWLSNKTDLERTLDRMKNNSNQAWKNFSLYN